MYFCDLCGFAMIERQCKVICPNCGHRFDCSDLTLSFESAENSPAVSGGQIDDQASPSPLLQENL